MKITKKGIDNITNQSMVDFDLDNSGGHLFTVLSELYSKPEESTLRELATNAADAHIMSNNQDRPFIIKLPNFEKNIFNFSVRDFGPGLTHEQVINIYKVYGRSTKTESDEETGCLGLGSKSPFSISSTFYVKSYKDGICSQYTCSMGNNGIPRITDVPIKFETFEENGLEVIVPIYKEFNFEKIITDTLKYFKVKPLVYIQTPELENPIQVDISWPKEKDFSFVTERVALNLDSLNLNKIVNKIKLGNGTAEVIQLQIFYPLDKKMIFDTINRFNKLYSDENNSIIPKFKISKDIIRTIGHFFEIGFQLHSKPGSIAFAPSRETIKYNELTLIYIIKELIYAARTINKIAEKKYNHIKTFNDCYNNILINSNDYIEVSKYFNNVKLLPVIVSAEKLFEKEHPSKNFLTNFSNLYTIKKGMVNSNYTGYINKTTSLRSVTLKNMVPGKGLIFRYFNIWDTSKMHFKDANYNKLAFSFCTPFMDIFIRSMYRKIYYINIDLIYNKLIKHMEQIILFSDDKYFMDIKYTYRNIPLVEKNHEVNPSVSIGETRKLTFDKIMEKLKKLSVYDFNFLYVENSPKNLSDEVLKDLLNKLENLKDFFLSNMKPEDLNTDINIVNCLKNIDTIKVNSFNINRIYFETSKIFSKMYLLKTRTKSKFNDLLKANVFDIKDFNFHCSKRDQDNKYHLLNDFFNLKSESLNHVTILSEYIVYYLFYLYPNEVENQVEYEKTDFNPFVKDWLLEIGLPIEHTLNIKPLERFKYVTSRSAKITNDPSDYKVGNLYYYNFEINDELFITFGNIVREIIDEIGEMINFYMNLNSNINLNSLYQNDIFMEYLDWKKGFTKKINFDILNGQNLYIKYNKFLNLIWNVSSEYSKFFSIIKEFEHKLGKHIDDSGHKKFSEFKFKLSENIKIINYNGQQLTTVIINNFSYVSILEESINKPNFNLKEECLYNDSPLFKSPIVVLENNIERFLSENEVCNFGEFKINYGKDFMITPNHIDLPHAEEFCKYINKTWELNNIQSKLTDLKTRKYRNNIKENYFSTVLEYLKYAYPEIKFINVENIPNKLKKHLINPISILVKTYYLKNFNELKLIDSLNEILNTSQNYLIPGSAFDHNDYPEFENVVSKTRLLLLLNEKEKIKHYKFYIGLIRPWTKKYKRFEKKYDEFLSIRLSLDPIIRRVLLLNNLHLINSQTEKDGLSLNEIIDLDTANVSLEYGKTNIVYSIRNMYRALDTFYGNLSSSLFSYQSLEEINKTFNKEFKDCLWNNSNFKRIKEFYNHNYKFIGLLEDLDSFLRYAKKEKKFNIEGLISHLKNFYSPKKTSIEFTNWNDFIEINRKNNNTKVLHNKINKRSS